MNNWQDHIERSPEIMLGKPVIKGTRLTVEHILDRLSDGWSVEQVVASYPRLTPEAVRAALRFAACSLATDEQVFLQESA